MAQQLRVCPAIAEDPATARSVPRAHGRWLTSPWTTSSRGLHILFCPLSGIYTDKMHRLTHSHMTDDSKQNLIQDIKVVKGKQSENVGVK